VGKTLAAIARAPSGMWFINCCGAALIPNRSLQRGKSSFSRHGSNVRYGPKADILASAIAPRHGSKCSLTFSCGV
jgi:hypothetical protein